ncbi:NAD+ synthase [Candidatus Vallotia lariciata]|uniref:NAD+ synthase n=1 Tax=Candidatus Vallotia laricis TaxID=2018052 RepID=UPI001D00370C|nr:NAD+ synthase [Candidatus Vallotia lariciata]UDG82903.1 Glutamine-dependent NAD(+) synthetase [Candidatus Vallotia lariciata]
MKIALAQINVTVGDFVGNISKIVSAAQTAYNAGASLMITPELVLSGYPPEDLLLRPAFYTASHIALGELVSKLGRFIGLRVLVGHIFYSPPIGPDNSTKSSEYKISPVDTFNAVSLIINGQIFGTYFKQELPNTGVFDEKRYFRSNPKPLVFELEGIKFGVILCEDAWHPYAALLAKAAGAQVLLVLNGSPYHINKENIRVNILRDRVHEIGMSIVYVNLVGAQDELVFDGGSFVLNAQGELVTRLPQFVEKIAIIKFDGAQAQRNEIAPCISVETQVYAALVLGVRDYVNKNGFPGAIIGLSGGVDSALVLAIASDALGANRVRAVMMPSRYTAKMSISDAAEMARCVGARYDEIAITPMFEAFRLSLASKFLGLSEDSTEENIQARIRGTLLMAMSNKFGSIVLTTSNKSEMAVGYCTLYGDMAGGLAVIKDISKTLVYQLCRYRNATTAFTSRDIIPERILTRTPSAELRENQSDQDGLPPYEVLDAIMKMYVEERRSLSEIVEAGYTQNDVQKITQLIKINEYKRRQAPIGIRVTHRAFGRDWRYPITSRFNEEC